MCVYIDTYSVYTRLIFNPGFLPMLKDDFVRVFMSNHLHVFCFTCFTIMHATDHVSFSLIELIDRSIGIALSKCKHILLQLPQMIHATFGYVLCIHLVFQLPSNCKSFISRYLSNDILFSNFDVSYT